MAAILPVAGEFSGRGVITAARNFLQGRIKGRSLTDPFTLPAAPRMWPVLPLHCTVSTLTPAYRTSGTWSQIPLKGSVPQKKANYPLFVDKEEGEIAAGG